MPAVSVIVLVYNSEKYLPKALESLFGQTLEDIEYVIVDDGSTDGSMKVLQDVLERYPRRREQVKIISNVKNLGQAESRRRGVEASTGEYVIHCDSDDWIELDMYEKMYDKAREGDFDMVLSYLDEVGPDGGVMKEVRYDFSGVDMLGALLRMDIHSYLPVKLVRRSAYEGIRFPVCNMWEDYAISIQLAANCKSFGFVEEILYHYLRHPEGLSLQTDTIDKMDQMRANTVLVEDFLKEAGLFKKYRKELEVQKMALKVNARDLPASYYRNYFPEVNLSMLLGKERTAAEKLGHITSLLGIHGISKKNK